MNGGQRSVRFTPQPFEYNLQVACALGPCLLVAAVLGGQAVMAILTLGAMLWYFLDALQYRDGAVTVVSRFPIELRCSSPARVPPHHVQQVPFLRCH